MDARKDFPDLSDEARRHLEQAYAYEERDEFENALRKCESAIQLAPGWAEAHNFRGIVLEELGRKKEAIAPYHEAVRPDPAFRKAQENLSEAEAEFKEEKEESSEVEATQLLSETGSRATISTPSAPPAPTPHTEEVPACSVCGRQDETLRLVAYPYVFSLAVLTFRRTFAGLWCKKHRNLRLALASLISATVGWIGIPFGFLFTPLTLFKLAQGGDQPVEPNIRLLKNLAENKLKEGDQQGAIRCLEEGLQLRDDETIRERLSELYRRYRLPAYEGGLPQALPFVGAMLGAIVVGAAIGVLDYVITAGFSSLFGGETSIYLVILSWTPLVAMAFIGGLILCQLIEWALAHTRCRQMLLGVSLAVVSASLALYGLPEGRAIGQYVEMLLSGMAFESTNDAILTSGAVLTRGGVWAIWSTLQMVGTSGIIDTLIVLACAVYYVITSVSAAVRTVKWQQRIAAIEDKIAIRTDRALAPGWVAVIVVVLGLAFFTSLFPQQGIVDYFEAIVHNRRGLELLEQGELDKAILEFQEVIHLRPGSAGVHSNLGWVYYYQGELDQALEAFQEAIRLDPGMADTHNGLGWVYYYQGELDQALEAFQEAIRLDPDMPEVHIGMGSVYVSQDNYKAAIDEFETAIELNPDSAEAYQKLGQVYYFQGALDEAVQQLQEALRLNPQSLFAHLYLGWAYEGRAEFKEAVEQLQTLIELQPDWGAPHAFLASVYYQLDQLDLTEREIQNALELQAENAFTYYALGLTYGDQRQFHEAETHLLKAIELSPDTDYLYLSLAYVYSAQKKFDLALQMCDKALELHENYADAYVARGDVYTDQENLDQALEELSRALELAPEDEEVHSDLSFIYFHQGQTAEALKEAKEAIRLQPYSANGHTNLAFACHAQGQLDLALAAAQEAVRLAPKSDRPHYILGLCYMDEGENEKAIAELEKFLDLYWDRAYAQDYKVKAEAYLAQLQ